MASGSIGLYLQAVPWERSLLQAARAYPWVVQSEACLASACRGNVGASGLWKLET